MTSLGAGAILVIVRRNMLLRVSRSIEKLVKGCVRGAGRNLEVHDPVGE